MLTTISPEQKMLILFARNHLTTDDVNKLEDIIDTHNINWDSLLRISREQKVSYFLPDHFNKLKKVPDYIKKEASTAYLENVIKQDKMILELFRLNEMLSSNKLNFLLLKGYALSKAIYNDSRKRSYNDIDLVFRTEDIVAAHTILINDGYKVTYPSAKATETHMRMMSNDRSHLFHYSNDNGVRVDMAHTFKDNLLNLEDLIQQATEIDNGIKIPNLIDLFIYSCYDAWKDIYKNNRIIDNLLNQKASLKQYMDIREGYLLIHNNKKLDDLYRRIQELNIQGIVSNSLYLAEKIYGHFNVATEKLISKEYFDNDWNSPNFTCTFEDRLFRPKEEYERIVNIYNNLKDKDSEQRIIVFNKYEKCTTDKVYNSEILQDDRNAVILFKDDNNRVTKEVSMTCAWNEDNIAIKIKFRGNERLLPMGEQEFIETEPMYWVNKGVRLSFSKYTSDIPTHFMIFTSQNKIVQDPVSSPTILRQMGIEKYLDIEEEHNLLKIVEPGAYEINITLPWVVTGINPHFEKRFLMNILLHIVGNDGDLIEIKMSGYNKGFKSSYMYPTIRLEE